MHQAFQMRTEKHQRNAMSVLACWLALAWGLSLAQPVQAEEPPDAAFKPAVLGSAAESEDGEFVTVSDANTPARLAPVESAPAPAPLHSVSQRPLACCRPNMPRPGQRVHPTLAALAEAVRPHRAQTVFSPAPAEPLRQDMPARQELPNELRQDAAAPSPLPVITTPPPRETNYAPARYGDPSLAPPPYGEAGVAPGRYAEMNQAGMDRRATAPPQPGGFGPSPSSAGFGAPAAAPRASQEPPTLPPGVKSKVIVNPWVKPAGEPAAQQLPQRSAAPVRLVRYHQPEPHLQPTAPAPVGEAAPVARRMPASDRVSVVRSARIADRAPPAARMPVAGSTLIAERARAAGPPRTISAAEWQTPEAELESNPLRTGANRGAPRQARWSNGNPLR